MVLRLISCSPRRRIRLVTVICGLKVCPNPVGPTSLRELDTSNGCQNDTSSPSAALRLSQRLRRAKRRSSACHSSAHGPYDPPCHPLTSPDAAASTASRPALVTTRDRPSVGQDGEGFRSDLGQARRKIFLQKGLDSGVTKTRSDLPVGHSVRSASTNHGESRPRFPIYPSGPAPSGASRNDD
jgi:hypothetical protein